MNKNVSFQHKEYLMIRELILKYAPSAFIEGPFWDQEWTFPLMRDLPHHDDLRGANYDTNNIICCTFDWNDICNYEWALPVIEKNLHRADWTILSRKSWASHLFDANPDKLVHSSLFANSAMMVWIDEHIDEVNYRELCLNSAAMHLIEKLPHNLINRYNLCHNSGALEFLEKNPNLRNWDVLSTQEWALPLLMKYPKSPGINWYHIASQSWAIDLIEQNLYQVFNAIKGELYTLYRNPAADKIVLENPQIFVYYRGEEQVDHYSYIPAYIDYLYANPDLIDWKHIQSNPEGIHLIEEKLCEDNDFLSWDIWDNPSVVTYNYKKIKEDRSWLSEGLAQHFYHPKYVEKWMNENPNKEIEEYDPLDL